MKAKKLAEILLKYPDFEVKASYADLPTYDHPFPTYHQLDVSDVEDIGFSDKLIVLELNKEV